MQEILPLVFYFFMAERHSVLLFEGISAPFLTFGQSSLLPCQSCQCLPVVPRIPGLLSGIILTFIPSMGLFFIADILGGNKIVLVGSLIQEQMTRGNNWPFAAALAVVLMVLTTLMIVLYRRITNVKELEGIG